MTWKRTALASAVAALVAVTFGVSRPYAQVGKSLGVVDVNVAPERDLAAMPSMTPAIAKALVASASVREADLNAFLLSQGADREQATSSIRELVS